MAVDGFRLLEIDGPVLEISFHEPERFLNPLVMVSVVDVQSRFADFRRNQKVVAGEGEVLVEFGLVQGSIYLDGLTVFVCSFSSLWFMEFMLCNLLIT